MKRLIASAILALTLIAGAASTANAHDDYERSWIEQFYEEQEY